MDILHARCAGLDVHKDFVSACVLLAGEGSEPSKHLEQFGTTTQELRRLSQWLEQAQVTHAAMESTGVYWKPVFNILESSCELVLVNSRQVRNVPGRKTDPADASWLARLLRHGLVEASFVPERETRQLRDLCRMRTTLVRESVQTGNRLRKVLEDANIKLDSVASDSLGVSGRSMIEALVQGETDPIVLAELARGRLRAKRPELALALEGRVTRHHRFLLGEWLRLLHFLEEQIARLEEQIESHMPPFEAAAALLLSMPGVDRTTACALLGEIGQDMKRFPSARHLASWAGVCPGNNQSGGRRKSGKSHRGNRWVKGVLTELAWAATRTKHTYASALYRRLMIHRGKKRALVAVAHHLLEAVWHMLTLGALYRELGPDYFDRLDHDRLKRNLVRRLQKLGYTVDVQPASAA
jgi:transposase